MNRDDLTGTWDLQRFWFTDDGGSEMDPLGEMPVGNLILGADGNYAFTMMRTGRSPYASGDLLGGTPDEKGEAADGYVSFGGTWTFDGRRDHLRDCLQPVPQLGRRRAGAAHVHGRGRAAASDDGADPAGRQNAPRRGALAETLKLNSRSSHVESLAYRER